MIQGCRVITGQSQQPLMMLVGDSLRAVVIVLAATSVGAAASPLYWTLTDGTSTAIVQLVTNSSTGPFQQIDNNLAVMQIGVSTIDTIEDGGNSKIASDLARDKSMSSVGVAGPAVVGGALLLLNKIALALFIGFGPLFILCLLFKQTAPLFQRWLLFGIGTVFSLAVLSVMISISMKMLTAVTAAYIAQYVASMALSGIGGGVARSDGLNSMALQQGGIGLILTTLIVSAPPMAAAFFQGTLGRFAAYSAFGRMRGGSAAYRQQMALGRSAGGASPENQNSLNSSRGDASAFGGRSIPLALGNSGYANTNLQGNDPGTYGLAGASQGLPGPGP